MPEALKARTNRFRLKRRLGREAPSVLRRGSALVGWEDCVMSLIPSPRWGEGQGEGRISLG